MADKMTFPATFKEFAEQYKIVDKEEVYTNGVELIPIFRVEQWLDNANVAILQAEIERLQKYNTDVAFKHYNDGKKDAAREIIRILRAAGINKHRYPVIAEIEKIYLGEDINAPTKESEGEG